MYKNFEPLANKNIQLIVVITTSLLQGVKFVLGMRSGIRHNYSAYIKLAQGKTSGPARLSATRSPERSNANGPIVT